MTIKNGDLPAMPVAITDTMVRAMASGKSETVDRITGLTKREHFAAMAMQGLSSESGRYHYPSEMAHDAVKLADALLAELERTKGEVK